MGDVERRIREAFAEAGREDAGPGFRELWHRAEAAARERAQRSRVRRLVLVPALVAAAAIVVAVLWPAAGPDPGSTAAALAATAGLDELRMPEFPSLPSDGLAGEVVRPGDVDRDLLLAWNDKLLESGTDWLLTLEIPAWGREEERKRP
jgi:hypothetical protein